MSGLAGMTSVRVAVEQLHRELAALARGTMSAPPARLQRARLQVRLALVPGSGDVLEWQLTDGPGGHLLELEWELGTPSPAGAGATEGAGAPELPLEAAVEGVFGRPGFDSAARATVFAEVAEGLGAARCLQVVAAVEQGATCDDRDQERARHLLQRLLERGPAGVTAGAGLLRQVLARHSLEQVLEILARRWRYGTGHEVSKDAEPG